MSLRDRSPTPWRAPSCARLAWFGWLLALPFALLSCPQQAADPPQGTLVVAGIWQAHLGTEPEPQLFSDLPTQGFRLVDVSGYAIAGEAHYASVWIFGDGQGFRELHGVDADTLQKANGDRAKEGLRLSHVSGFRTHGGTRYAAIWEPSFDGSGPASTTPNTPDTPDTPNRSNGVLRVDLSGEALGENNIELQKEHLRLVDVSGFEGDDGTRFAALWSPAFENSPPTDLRLDLDGPALDAALAEASTRGARVVRIGGYMVNDEARFYLLLVRAPGPLWIARHDLTSATYQVVLEDLVQLGYRISHLSAYTVKGEARYAVVWTQ